MKLRNLVLLILSVILYSCGTKTVSTHKVLNVKVGETGIIAIGTGMSQIEKVSNSIAVRMARAELVDYLNIALAKTDEELGFSPGTHKEDILRGSKIVDITLKNKGNNILTTAKVELGFEEVRKWAENYYNSLPSTDLLRGKVNKDEFISMIYKYLNNKI